MIVCEQFDEVYVRLLLDGSENEVKEGVALIHLHLCLRVMGWVRKKFPSLKADELEDVWSDTLSGILQTQVFDPEKPLFPWLCTIAYRKAVDRRRRKTSMDKLVEAVGRRLKNTQTGSAWKNLDSSERHEVFDLIARAVSQLPARQRLIMDVFVSNFPDTESMLELQRLVSEHTGKPETLAAVKRALQEARAKVKKSLRNKGYNFGKQGEL